ncbi:unnamed protein product [Peniophora sp. CBMAI 1063]|nr:unnamed protein product [Peniophora sp. CBMAI 1063]
MDDDVSPSGFMLLFSALVVALFIATLVVAAYKFLRLLRRLFNTGTKAISRIYTYLYIWVHGGRALDDTEAGLQSHTGYRVRPRRNVDRPRLPVVVGPPLEASPVAIAATFPATTQHVPTVSSIIEPPSCPEQSAQSIAAPKEPNEPPYITHHNTALKMKLAPHAPVSFEHAVNYYQSSGLVAIPAPPFNPENAWALPARKGDTYAHHVHGEALQVQVWYRDDPATPWNVAAEKLHEQRFPDIGQVQYKTAKRYMANDQRRVSDIITGMMMMAATFVGGGGGQAAGEGLEG